MILNVTTASACNVTAINSTPKVTAIDPVNKSIVLNPKVIKIKFNTAIKDGNKLIQLKSTSNGKISPTETSISGDTLSIIPTTNLTKGSKYQILIHSGSVEESIWKWCTNLFNQFHDFTNYISSDERWT